MSIITLTTDYGLKDHFVGALKGKLLSEFPDVKLIDLSHDIDPFNITETSYIVGAAYASFPKKTVHLIGVDSEKNKETRHLAAEWDDHFFICADNGILGLLMQKMRPQKIVEINIHDRLPVEATDLDVFVTVACHLSRGGLLNVIGKETKAIRQFTELKPSLEGNALKGYVVYIDHFGNVVTNISKQQFLEAAKGRPYEIVLNQRSGRSRSNIRNIWPKYSDIAVSDKYPVKYYEGDKLAIFNEAGYLEIAIFRSNPSTVGSAASLLGLGYRDAVTVLFSD